MKIIVFIAFLLYFLPTIIAWYRSLPNRWSVLIVDFFFGWSIIGWVIALAMACSRVKSESYYHELQ